jgi:cell division protein FtsL
MTTIDIHFDKRIDNSRIVREADARCRLEYMCLTLLGAMFVLGTLFYAWQQYQWIQYGYRIEESHKQIETLVEVGRQFRVERATLTNPQRIDFIARTELGMKGPTEGQLVSLEGNFRLPSRSEGLETLVARTESPETTP